MKLVAEVFKLPSGSLIPQFYCVDENGDVVRGVTDTLLNLVAESLPNQIERLTAILVSAQKGTYERSDPNLADWSVNDKFVWVGPPRAEMGFALISNENIPDFSSDDGEPQKFSIEQFLSAIAHWNEFREMLSERGMGGLVGDRFEGVI
ncbi:hypothetical protein LBW59_16930 [Ralstonia solanacearum]|uniref:Uncharacterized protein n=1 Tax=Ralstonia solanacearum TaxID=305 RepID=A0AAW5ZSH8_RALSL|nr:hypothetical protein [Ralstonia solanacearum]MDB0572447.1 hypothetical protein [Ralstonia solanacearum]